jgi:hypothetical protein
VTDTPKRPIPKNHGGLGYDPSNPPQSNTADKDADGKPLESFTPEDAPAPHAHMDEH